ncbi:MAG: hypothetical protein V5A45_10305 [Haloarculaceae archaeon]
MNRRALLAGTTATLGTALAGCTALGGERSLGQPREELDANGREKHLVFERNGKSVVTITLQQRTAAQNLPGRFGLRVVISHSENTNINKFSFELRAPPTSVEPPAEIYLKQPDGGPWPPIDFQRTENEWTRIAVDDLGDLGRGTLGLETIVAPLGDSVEAVGVRPDLTLGTTGLLSGGPLRAETQTEFEPVVE